MTDERPNGLELLRAAEAITHVKQLVNAAATGDRVVIVHNQNDVAIVEEFGARGWHWDDPGPDLDLLRALRGVKIELLVPGRDGAALARACAAYETLQAAGAEMRCIEGRGGNPDTLAESVQKGHTLDDAVDIEPEELARRAGISLNGKAPHDGTPERAEAPASGAQSDLSIHDGARFPNLKAGDRFVLDDPADLEAVWGSGDQVLWASGEPLLIVGPTGVGKTTLAMQLIAGRLGVLPELLGWPIQDDGRNILYLAMDRPRQIRRAMRRIFDEEHRQLLEQRLVVWEGPLPLDLGKNPTTLLELAREVDAGTVLMDSLKDAVVKLTEDEAGGNYNRAVQHLVADGRQFAGLHHQRKGQGGANPSRLEDVYGSTWITAGAGSVLLLWGAAGDPIVELRHLKQPAAEVGPLKIEHDHLAGRTSLLRGVADPLKVLRNSGSNGLDATTLARVMFEVEKPTDNQRRKAERALDRLARDEMAIPSERVRNTDGTLSGRRYYPAETRHDKPAE
jgi:replicative DNA helicase